MKSIKFKQRDIMDCGAASIASIAAHYKLDLPVARIRQLASTDKKGTNVLGLLEALEKLGFQAKGVRGIMDSLRKIPTPAIAHVAIKEGQHHYLVIYDSKANYIEVMDPADGQMHRYTNEDFERIWTGVLIILLPGENFKSGSQKKSILSRFWYLITPHKGVMIQALTGALVYTLIGLSTSIYIQKITDHVLQDGNRNLLNLMSIGMIALLILQVYIGSLKNIFTFQTGQLIDIQLILGYYKHLLKLPQQFFDTMRVGEIISRVNDAVKIRSFINESLTNIAVSVFIVVFSFFLMFTYYWKLALVILLIIPLYSIVYFITNKLNKKVERRLMENAAELESQFVESLNSIGTIKSFGLEPHANIKTEIRFIGLLKTVYTSGMNSIFSGSSAEFLSRLFTIILLWVGVGFVLDNLITPGELLSFYALVGYFTNPVTNLISMNKIIQNAMIAADRLFEIMDLEIERQDNRIKLTKEMIGDISFMGVNFRYGSRAPIFEDFNLSISKGRVTAIVGESGSGKTTLMGILQNLYPIQSGKVSIGNYDLKHVDNESLRDFVSVVPQKIDLFAGNVVENIAVGDYQPDMKKIIDICTDLGILDFIEKLPNSFNTYIGENGTTLSGGQRQRLAIARSLYREPEILILDEATSSLDSTSEKDVQRMIKILLKKEKTVILIAHRLSTIFHADKIVVLKNGKVVEEGDHQGLLLNRNQYYELWTQQFPMMAESA